MSEDETMVVPEVTIDVEVPAIFAIECPEGTVPGWLDENNNPQGCVDNNPTPGIPKDETPIVVDTPETVVPSQTDSEIVSTPTYQEPIAPDQIETGVLVSPTPPALADTGMGDPLTIAAIGVLLVGAGIVTTVRARILGNR